MAECPCCSDGAVRPFYACSGAANTGMLADQVARTLMTQKTGKMTCLAAVGADLSGFIESARTAGMNIVIDGCPVSCGKRIFENRGLPYRQFMMTSYGVENGKTVITPEVIADVARRISKELGGS